MQKASSFKLDHLKELIANGKTKSAIKALLEISKNISSDFHTSMIMQSARFTRLERQENLGIISKDDYGIGSAQINYALLELLGDVPTELQVKAIIDDLNTFEESRSNIKNADILIPEKPELEKIIGREEIFEISWLTKALNASKSVCKVQMANGEAGTGFILKGGYLVTNNHVIPTAQLASTSKIIFNYRVDERENVMERAEYRLDPQIFITGSPQKLDYSVIKVLDDDTIPLSEWGFLEIEDFYNPKIGDKVNIIQHPEGNYMKIALPDEVISLWEEYLFYIADTKPGSSGSPVFNQDWKIIALHHAGKNEKSTEGGLQINAKGDIRPSNRGILIRYILDDIAARGFKLI